MGLLLPTPEDERTSMRKSIRMLRDIEQTHPVIEKELGFAVATDTPYLEPCA